MFPRDPADDTALLMEPLLRRGKDALTLRIMRMAPEDRPIGATSVRVVREDDFLQNAGLCLRYVRQEHQPLHILCDDGVLCAQLAWKRA